jgi:thymidine phosphorylase
VSAGAGVVLLAKPGEAVTAGQPLLELHTDDPARFARAIEALDGSIDVGGEFAASALIHRRITA